MSNLNIRNMSRVFQRGRRALSPALLWLPSH